MPAVLADTRPEGVGSRRRAAVPVVAFALLGAVWAGGEMRLSGASDETVPGVRLRLVQPNIPQALKWKRELRQGHVLKQLEMSKQPAGHGPPPTHVIWAETAVPYFLTETPGLAEILGAVAPPGGLLITGAPRTTAGGEMPKRFWNSLHAIDSDGRIRGTYDKHHLVPFGEYVPFRGILPLGKLTAGRQDFSPGPGVETLEWAGLPPVSPLICYEIIFPGRVAAVPRPQWILNLTNDAWFGFSTGPYQHFAASRLRAVEEGLPVVRVANTGISGVVDAHGRVIKQLSLGQTGIIDSPLPVALTSGTPFSRFPGGITSVILIIALGVGFLLTPRITGRGKH
jgi:apolipoprotein N-acyltransferase